MMSAHHMIEKDFADRLIAKTPFASTRRFAVYRNNLFVSLVEALIARYPAVQAAVGPDFFAAMARDYAADHVPDTPLMMYYGDDFPDSLAIFEPLADYPWIADLARVERAITQIYHAADSQGLAQHELAAIQNLTLDTVQFRLIDALTCIGSQFPIVTLWNMNMGHIAPHTIDAMPSECALIYRPDFTVKVKSLTAAEAVFVNALRDNIGVGAAFEAALAHDSKFDLAVILDILIREHLIKQIITPTAELDIA